MRAVVMRELGDPDVLHLEDVPVPEAGPGEVLVRVEAASVNPLEYKQRRGAKPKELPAILGSDIAGAVEVSNAEGFASGEAVYGIATSGAYAEYAVSRPHLLAHMPPGLSVLDAAALPVAGMTAWQALFDRGGLEAEQTVAITGASGGVGHLAVQFAKQAGAKVIGIASQRNRDFVLGLGADEFIDYTTTDLSDADLDVELGFDCVGGPTTAALLANVRARGTLVAIAGAVPEREAQARGLSASVLVMQADPEELLHIGRLVADGIVRVHIDDALPLEEIVRAHTLIESGHTRGKIVLNL